MASGIVQPLATGLKASAGAGSAAVSGAGVGVAGGTASGADIVAVTTGGTVSGLALGGWNQLWRQLAQRTVRPAVPIAVSGTT